MKCAKPKVITNCWKTLPLQQNSKLVLSEIILYFNRSRTLQVGGPFLDRNLNFTQRHNFFKPVIKCASCSSWTWVALIPSWAFFYCTKTPKLCWELTEIILYFNILKNHILIPCWKTLPLYQNSEIVVKVKRNCFEVVVRVKENCFIF